MTLDKTGAAQLETEHELRASLSMRLMKEVAQQLETLSMIREAAWDDSQRPSGVLDEFASPRSRKKAKTDAAHRRQPPATAPPAPLRPNLSHKTGQAGRSHQPYSSSADEMADRPSPLPSQPCLTP